MCYVVSSTLAGTPHKEPRAKAKDKPAEPVPAKRAKLDPVELQDSLRTSESTLKFFQFSEADQKESRRDVGFEERKNARKACAFGDTAASVDFKFAQLMYLLLNHECNTLHLQELARTVYYPDGGVQKAGHTSIRSSSNTAFREGREIQEWAAGEHKIQDPNQNQPAQWPVFPGCRTPDEWRVELARRRAEQGGDKRRPGKGG